MPWFATPTLLFLHVPKTGGSWATDAMCSAGIRAHHPPGSPPHLGLAPTSDYADRFTMAFVRHPLDYWRSYWAYRMRDGWDMSSELDGAVHSEDFTDFVERVITFAPGFAGWLFEQFVGPPDAEVTFVGRHERLVDDVCLALRLAGEPFHEPTLRDFPRVNVSDYRPGQALYPRALAERLAEVESRAIRRFYPWEPVPERLVIGGRIDPEPDPLCDRVKRMAIELRDARAELIVSRTRLAGEVGDLNAARAELLEARAALARRPLSRLRKRVA